MNKPDGGLPEGLSFTDYLRETVPDEPPQMDEAWAGAKLRELAEISKRIQANNAYADTEHSRIDGWEQSVNNPLLARKKDLEAALKSYGRYVREATGKATVKLPWGTLRSSPRSNEWTFGDDFIEWAKTNRQELVRTSYSVVRNSAKTAFTLTSDGEVVDPATGEQIPGVAVKLPDPGDEYSVSITLEKEVEP